MIDFLSQNEDVDRIQSSCILCAYCSFTKTEKKTRQTLKANQSKPLPINILILYDIRREKEKIVNSLAIIKIGKITC